MMGIGHIFTARARIQQIDFDNTASLADYDIQHLCTHLPKTFRSHHTGETPIELARRLHAAKVNLCTDNHYFMRWAASHNDLPLMQELHRLGADAGACNGYAARYSCFNGNLDALRWLHGLGLLARHREDGLSYAAGPGHLPVLNYLESLGPLPQPQPRALFAAARSGRVEILQWLTDRGGDPRAEDDFIMFHAMTGADIPTLEWVKAQGVNLHAFNDHGQFHAAYTGNVAAFAWCEDNGIPLNPYRIATAAANCGDADLLEWAQKRGGIVGPHAEKSALALSLKNGDDHLKSLIMAQRTAKAAALVDTAIKETISPPPLATRLWRLLKS